MAIRSKSFFFLCLFLLTAIIPSYSLVVQQSFDELVSSSETVVLGTVTSLRYSEKFGHACTWVTVLTENNHATGNAGELVEFVTLGGMRNGLMEYVHEEAHFNVGERVLIVARRDDFGDLSIAGMKQGKYAVDEDNIVISTGMPVEMMLERANYIRTGELKNGYIPMPLSAPQGVGDNPPTATCCGYMDYNGAPIRWSSSCPSTNYKVYENCANVTNELTAIQNAMTSWNNVPSSCARLNYTGTASACSSSSSDSNVICFNNLGSGGTIGVTYVYFTVGSTCYVAGWDMALNSYYTWSTTCESGKMDVETITLHEMGHVLIMDDLYDSSCSSKIMYGYGGYGVCKHSPCNDEACLNGLYPNSTPIKPACTITGPSSPTTTSPIPFSIVFTEAVTGFTASDITVTNGTKGTLTGGGTTYSIPVTPTSQGAVTCQVAANTVTDSCSNTNTVSNLCSVTYSSPTNVINVTSSNANGAYRIGQVIYVQVQFSKDVVVTGIPRLQLAVSAGRWISYDSMANSSTAIFKYTVLSGDNAADLDYMSATALILNSGTINDINGAPANLTLPAPAASGSLGYNKNIVIDTIAPTVAGISAPTMSLTKGGPVSYTVNFSEFVDGFDSAADIQLNTTGTATAGSKIITGSGSGPYTVTLSSISGTGTVGITVVSSAAQDPANNNSSTSSPSSTFNVDNTAPVPGTAVSPASANTTPIVVSYSGASDTGSSLIKVELWYKKDSGAWTYSGMFLSTASGSFNFASVSGDGTYYFDLVAEDTVGNRSAAPTGSGDTNTVYSTAPPQATIQGLLAPDSSGSCNNQGKAYTWKIISTGQTGTGTLGAGGAFSFNVPSGGSSDICLKMSGALSVKFLNVSLTGTQNVGSKVVVQPDMLDDDAIDDFELNEINGAFGSNVTSGYGADYNCDGIYDDFDMNQINGSFGATGECYGQM